MVTGCVLEDWGSDRNYFSSPPPNCSVADPKSCLSVLKALYPGAKRQERETVEVKNAWSSASTSSYVMTWCIIKHRDKFSLYFLQKIVTEISMIHFSIRALYLNLAFISVLMLIITDSVRQIEAAAWER
jgi:hypothetical protein